MMFVFIVAAVAVVIAAVAFLLAWLTADWFVGEDLPQAAERGEGHYELDHMTGQTYFVWHPDEDHPVAKIAKR